MMQTAEATHEEFARICDQLQKKLTVTYTLFGTAAGNQLVVVSTNN